MSGTFAPIDLGDIALGQGGFVIQGEDVRDGAGYSVASLGDVNGDGFDDLIVGAPNADAAGNAKGNAGAAYVVFGKATGFGASIDLAQVSQGQGGFVIQGEDPYDAAGISVASAGDLNGDGFDDLMVGAFLATAAGSAQTYSGAAYIVYGKASGFASSIHLAEVAQGQGGFIIRGEDERDFAGFSLASAGDVNGDGFTDLIIGAPFADGADNTKPDAGAAYVVLGKAAGFGASVDLIEIALGQGGFVINGEDLGDYAGISVASAGDLNGDGLDDVIVGASGADGTDNAKAGAGAAYVVFGKATDLASSIDLADVAQGQGGFVIQGEELGDVAARSVASAGDVNGDGFDDLIVGAYRADAAGNVKADAGAAYVVFGKVGGFGASIDLGQVSLGQGGFVIQGEESDDRAGRSVASAGDVNGDGFDDLIVGADRADAAANAKTEAGAAYVVFGKATGFAASIDLAAVALGLGGFVIQGEDPGDGAGLSVAAAGDLNGDGFDDLLVGAYSADAADNAKNNAGAAYVVFGSSFGASPTISIAAAAATRPEGDTDVSGLTFTVTRTGVVSTVASVCFAVTGSGRSPADVRDFGGSLPIGTVEFAAGETQKTLTIRIAGDLTIEPDETFTVTLSSPSAGATIGTASATGTILNDDAGSAVGTPSRDTLTGSNLADLLDGLAGADRLTAQAGDDKLFGGDGNDVLVGNQGEDALNGGADDDRLIGGGGDDLLFGGAGADRFVFRAAGRGERDTIVDFNAEDGDRIDLSGFPGDVTLIGDAVFSGSGGELRVSGLGFAQRLEIDANGDGVADLQIDVLGAAAPAASWFTL